MSDIFREVDEEVRREQFQKIWDRYGLYIIAGLILFVAAIAGWRTYDWYENKAAAEAGAAFEAAATLSQEGKSTEAQAAFAKIATEGTSGYRAIARMREATELGQRDAAAAVAAFDKLAADTSLGPVLQDLAGLRAAALLVDTASFADITKRLDPLTGSGRTFRHSAREMLVLSAWRAGDMVAAKRWYDTIQVDPETPQALRGRVDVLMALVNADSKS